MARGESQRAEREREREREQRQRQQCRCSGSNPSRDTPASETSACVLSSAQWSGSSSSTAREATRTVECCRQEGHTADQRWFESLQTYDAQLNLHHEHVALHARAEDLDGRQRREEDFPLCSNHGDRTRDVSRDWRCIAKGPSSDSSVAYREDTARARRGWRPG